MILLVNHTHVLVVAVLQLVQKLAYIMVRLLIVQLREGYVTVVGWWGHQVDRIVEFIPVSLLFLFAVSHVDQLVDVVRELWITGLRVLSLDLCLALVLQHFQGWLTLGFLLSYALIVNLETISVHVVGFGKGLQHVLELLGQNKRLTGAIFGLTEQ